MKKIACATLAMTALALTASAQQVSTYTLERKASADQPQQVLLDKIKVAQAQVTLQTKTVPNAPYSAEATNESIQVLQDGNRIVKRTVTRVYRDSAGRTRKETLDDSGQVTLVAVSDPTTGVSYVSDPRNNAVSQSMVKLRTATGDGQATWTSEQGTVTAVPRTGTTAVYAPSEKMKIESGAASGQIVARSGGVAGGAGGSTFVWTQGVPAKGETTKEDLGQQTIEGVTATGTRTTTVIPAGAIGNEQPITIVSEEWTSPELQVLVLTKHSDPRTGETTYRLTGINRTEPAKALFEAPVAK
jgi:hypothetical protein